MHRINFFGLALALTIAPSFSLKAYSSPDKGWKLDPTFNIGQKLTRTEVGDPFPSYPTSAYTAALSRNGSKIYLAGDFNVFDGKSIGNYLVRLNFDGTLDKSFNIGTGFDTSNITSIVVDSKNRAYIAGLYQNFNGKPTTLARLNENGSADQSFQVQIPNGYVTSLTLDEANGSAYILGIFSISAPVQTDGIARLSLDGKIDPSFQLDPGLAKYELSLRPGSKSVLLTGEKLIVSRTGLLYVAYDAANDGIWAGTSRIVRLHRNGSIDASFDFRNVNLNAAFEGRVADMYETAEGNLLVSGEFEYRNADGTQTGKNIVRLKPNGEIDPTFHNPRDMMKVYSMVYQSKTGSIYTLSMLSPNFDDQFPNYSETVMRKLNADGSVDPNAFADGGLRWTSEAEAMRSLAFSGTEMYVLGDSRVNGKTRAQVLRLMQ